MTGPGKILRSQRLASGLSIEQLAEKVGVAPAFLSALEHGERPLARPLIARLEKIFGIYSLFEPEGTAPGERVVVARATKLPYKGLYPYTSDDASKFFGREDFVRAISTSLSFSKFCLISGPSGSGKSSLVNAGVIADLEHRGDTSIIAFRPGKDPARAFAIELARMSRATADGPAADADALDWALGNEAYLSERLARLGTPRVLIFIDQLEELFRVTSDVDCVRFKKILVALESHSDLGMEVHVLSSLRSDFLGMIAADVDLSRLFSSSIFLVPPLGRSDITDIITKPISDSPVEIDEAVVSMLCEEVVSQPAALPILSFCLETLWRNRKENRIGTADLDAIGGFSGLLTSIAEAQFATLSTDAQAVARHLLLQMVAFAPPGASEPNTKRRLETAGLSDPERQVIDRFVSARLLAADSAADGTKTVEFAHETLMKSWSRLAEWIEIDGEVARFLQTLESASRAWQAEGRAASLLWSGARLSECNAKLKSVDPSRVNPRIRDFVAESNAAQRRQDIDDFNSLASFLNEASPGMWGDLIPHFREIGAERLRRVEESLPREFSLREKVALASVGAAEPDEALKAWQQLPRPELLLAVKLLRENSTLPGWFVAQMQQQVTHNPLAMLIWSLAREPCAQPSPLPEVVLGYELDQLPALLAGLPGSVANEIVQCVLSCFPLTLASFVKALYAPEDADTFSRCFLALRSAAEKSAAIKAQLLPLIPLEMFGEFVALAPQPDGSRPTAVERPAFDHPRHEAQYVAANSSADNIELLAATLGNPDKVAVSSWLVCRAKDLALPEPRGDWIGGEAVQAVRSPHLAIGYMLQLLETSAASRNGGPLSLLPTIERAVEIAPTAFVIASAEWLMRQICSDEAVSDAIASFPESGPDFFTAGISGCDERARFVRVPPVHFTVGLGASQLAPIYLDSETSHEVVLSNEFWMADRLVTRKLYQALQSDQLLAALPEIGHVSRTADSPVVAITWDEARDFSERIGTGLSGDRQLAGRLPCEVEWEAACRSGTDTAFSFGDDDSLLPHYGWYACNAGNQTHPGARKRPNSLGLFDMHGNCWEWCENSYGDYDSSDPMLRPKHPAATRALRGGCWNLGSEYARSFTRNAHSPGNRNYYLSFRPMLIEHDE